MDQLAKVIVFGILLRLGCCVEVTNPKESSQDRPFKVPMEKRQEMVLSCEVRYSASENAFNNPVNWAKTQETDKYNLPAEAVNVANGGRLSTDFDNENRFQIEYASVPGDSTRHQFTLTITDAKVEDSGRYFCFSVEGDQVKYIMYDVEVKDDPDVPILTGEMDDGNTTFEHSLIFQEGQRRFLNCTVVGGMPQPTLHVSIEGGRRLTGFLDTETRTILDGPGADGLRKIVHITTLSSNRMQLNKNENGKMLVCDATVGDDSRVVQSVRKEVIVQFRPTVGRCEREWEAAAGDKNVSFSCTYEANPQPVVAVWTIRHQNGNTDIHSDGKLVEDNYVAFSELTDEVGESGLNFVRTRLTFLNVDRDSFQQKYELTLTNSAGRVVEEFNLREGQSKKPDPGSGTVVTDNSATCGQVSGLLVGLLTSLLVFANIRV